MKESKSARRYCYSRDIAESLRGYRRVCDEDERSTDALAQKESRPKADRELTRTRNAYAPGTHTRARNN